VANLSKKAAHQFFLSKSVDGQHFVEAMHKSILVFYAPQCS